MPLHLRRKNRAIQWLFDQLFLLFTVWRLVLFNDGLILGFWLQLKL
jgi:hypothetical protein